MEITQIPFAKLIGIQENNAGQLQLAFTPQTHNHLQTMHASAQFTLAETASGALLQSLFPELVDKVIPVLRKASASFKKPAIKDIVAFPSVDETDIKKFRQQLDAKQRASISVHVDIKDSDGTLTSSADYQWFVQKIN